MRYLALATDYDGTIAHDELVPSSTIDAINRLRQSGRKIILVTGRELPDLARVFHHFEIFDLIVAENGAVLYNPATREKRILAERPPDKFADDLRARNVTGISQGDVIVATWHPHETAVLESIRDLGLELQVIFNKDAVMVLPAGVNKMTGLNHALADLKLSRHNVVGVGDAENDHAFLGCCECSVAVSNAIPALKERVDWVTDRPRGEGVEQLISRLLEDDLRSLPSNPRKHGILLGTDVPIEAEAQTILLCGLSGGGKSTFVAGFIERLLARSYQTCLIDPEGDFEDVPGFVTIGNKDNPPSYEQIFQLLDAPGSNVTVNLVGVKLQDRPAYFASLLAKLQEKKLREGRPHWIVIDEAHHLLPAEWAPAPDQIAGQSASMLLVTVHPQHVAPAALRLVRILAIIGKDPHKSAAEFAKAIGIETPAIPAADLEPGEVAVWFRDRNRVIDRMQSIAGKTERKRHRRKYAEGELDPERIFYFKGPQGKLKLRAQNLNTFTQLAAGVDDDTWIHHLHQHDYSAWVSTAIKDPDLAAVIRQIENDNSLTPQQSREAITKSIEEKYTAPV